ncbi:MAG TPA: Hpt domain-containing protein, partial [Pararobbsia sp.]|nr:Hpt domain-containing protein [Pararobbsia sp.]
MNLDDALQTFFAEARELLTEMEAALLRIADESEPDRAESINAIFRAAHTIKGSSGLFGLDVIVSFTHVVESVLDQVRNSTLSLDDDLIALLLRCGDHIAKLVERVEAGDAALPDDDRQAGDALLHQLDTRLNGVSGAHSAAHGNAASSQVRGVASDQNEHALPGRDTALRPAGGDQLDARADYPNWHIALRFGANVLRNGMDPLSFIRYLGTIGKIEHIETIPDAIPPLDALDPESCYLGFEILFASEADQATIENVFEFV